MTAPTETRTGGGTPWIPDLDSCGARLALLRQKMGWGNVAEAARECGLDRESWRLWEQTGREPRRFITVAMAIATRTGVDLDWLVYGPAKAAAKAPERARAKGADPTNKYAPKDPLAPRVIGPIRHGDGRRNRSKNVGRMADQPAISTPRIAAVSQDVLA